MNSPNPTPKGMARFIPGLALIKGLQPRAAPHGIRRGHHGVCRARALGDGLRRSRRGHSRRGAVRRARRHGDVRAVWLLQAGHHGPRGDGRDHDGNRRGAAGRRRCRALRGARRAARDPCRRRRAARPCREAGVHHRPLVQAGAGRLHPRRDADRHRQPVGQDVRHQAGERQVLSAGGGAHQPPGRGAPPDRRHRRRLYGDAADHAPRESQAARPADRRRRRHHRLLRFGLGGQGGRRRRRGAAGAAQGNDPRGHGFRYLCPAARGPGAHDPDLCR